MAFPFTLSDADDPPAGAYVIPVHIGRTALPDLVVTAPSGGWDLDTAAEACWAYAHEQAGVAGFQPNGLVVAAFHALAKAVDDTDAVASMQVAGMPPTRSLRRADLYERMARQPDRWAVAPAA